MSIELQITQLVNYVKQAFKNYMLRKQWLDPTTRRNGEEKVRSSFTIYARYGVVGILNQCCPTVKYIYIFIYKLFTFMK